MRAAILFSFFGWILRQLRLHWLSELFLFLSKQSISQAIFRLVSKEMLRSQQLVSLSSCHWSGREKVSSNCNQFFFFRRFTFPRLCFFLWKNELEKKKKKHPFKFRKVRDVIATMGLLVTLLKRKREAKCKSFWGKSGSRLSFCGEKSQMARRKSLVNSADWMKFSRESLISNRLQRRLRLIL